MRVAVVKNQVTTGVINTFGRECPEKYGAKAIQDVVQALEENGHRVLLCEGDKTLLTELEKFMPAAGDGRPGGMVFNMSYGIQGECRYTHVPAALEMAGVPYTGSSPLGHALALDKVITKILIRAAGVPTPNFEVMKRFDPRQPFRLRFPVVVKPRHESTSFGLQLVYGGDQLKQAVRMIVEQFQQDALVEEYIDGREVCVGLLGNQDMEFLPLVEQDFGLRRTKIVTWEDKVHHTDAEARKICPAELREDFTEKLKTISLATFRACQCRDYARVDIRIDKNETPYVLEINSMASLGGTGSYVLAASTAGYSFAELVDRILNVAHARYFGIPALHDASGTGAPHAAVTQ
jgi:D-alanine-D-alanine ligase